VVSISSKKYFLLTNTKHTLIFVSFLITVSLIGKPVYVDGTYDLDGDNLSELLILYDEEGKSEIRFVEIQENGIHSPVWSYIVDMAIPGVISDIKMADLNHDDIPEIIVILRTEIRLKQTQTPWLMIFTWEEQSFSVSPLIVYEEDLPFGPIRSSNFAVLNDNNNVKLAVAFSTPMRTGSILDIEMNNDEVQLKNIQLIESPVISNGYGKVFIGSFLHEETNRLVLFTTEANLLKASVYEDQINYDLVKKPISEVFSLNGSRNLSAMEIMAKDEDLDGNEELILPFQSGEVFSLSFEENKLVFKPSAFHEKAVFLSEEINTEEAINSLILTRVEEGLYSPPLITPTSISEEISATKGKDRAIDGVAEKSVKEENDLSGATKIDDFVLEPSEPEKKIIVIENRKDKDGVVIDSRNLPQKDVSLISEVLSQELKLPTNSLEEKISDSSILLEKQSFSITFQYKNNGNTFSLEGDQSFYVKIDTTEKTVKHKIVLDLNNMEGKNKVSFEYKSNVPESFPTTQISITHDLKTNMLLVSKSPISSSIPQSFNPEAWSSQLQDYPEYLFDGFSSAISMDFDEGGILQFTIEKEALLSMETPYIEMVSPSNPPQKFKLFLASGNFQKIKSVVKVRKSGSIKTVTWVDFVGEVVPVSIKISLEGQTK